MLQNLSDNFLEKKMNVNKTLGRKDKQKLLWLFQCL